MSTKKTIAKSFTVSTIEDGVSVQAQYAPNANPTSGQIHTVWQNGDLYMRTRESDEAAWSIWHKIVGESGDETDFSFGISQYKTTANASTAPSDISSWSDAPLAVTTAKPYLWAKVQQKSWNASTQAYVVDSTRYIRLTGEDGYTVEAQYAPNNNPTSSQIHTTWQDGDLYMRTKQSNETTWSSWHKIVGESGDETDYSFNISKETTSASATTAPANCYYNTWQDAPIAPTSTYPYLWMKIVKKTWNESTQSYDSGTARYARITGEPGTSPYFADLNNEMDAIQCKHDGSVITTQTVSTVISMWKGSAVETFVIDKIYRNGTQLTWGSTTNGVKPSKSGSTVSIEFNTNASIADIDDFKITIHSYNDNTVTRELHFTINGVRANAIYRLVPSHSQIVKKKDGTYVPSGNVTCSVEKIENGSTSTPSSSEYTLEKSVNGGSYTTYSATAASSITSDLKFRLTVGGVVVDLETIPLVSDGNNGDGGVSYSIVFTKAAAKVENNIVTAELAGYAYKYVGGVRSALASTTIRYGYILTDSDTYATTTTISSGFFDAGTWFNGDDITDYGKNSPSIFAAIVIDGTVVHAEMITISVKGNTGQRGKVGRFFYYAGTFSVSDTTTYFIVNDAQSPYFLYNNNYWVYNPENNPSGGHATMSQMGTPSPSSANWKIMTSDFKYIITEAIFGSYAHFGSAIINGDWLISGNGTIQGDLYENGALYNGEAAYTYFDPMFPFGVGNANLELLHEEINWASTVTPITNSFTLKDGRTYVVKILCHVERAYAADTWPILKLWIAKDNAINNDGVIGTTDTSMYDADQIFQKAISITSGGTHQEGEYTVYARMETNINYGYGYIAIAVLECQTNTMFVPQYCVDLLSGESSMAGGKVRALRDGSMSIRGALMYSSLFQDSFRQTEIDTTTSPTTYTYNLDSGVYEGNILNPRLRSNYFGISGSITYTVNSKYYVYLPPARLFEGAEITIINNARDSSNLSHLAPLTIRVPNEFDVIDPIKDDASPTVALTWNRFTVMFASSVVYEGDTLGISGTYLRTSGASLIKLIAAKHPLIEYYHPDYSENYKTQCIAWCVVDAK